MIIDAKRIAMHEERAVDDRRVRKDRRAARPAESVAEQEVAVAVHQADPCAAGGQAPQKAGDHGIERRLEVLVADPVLEEIAEDEKRVRARGVVLDEIEEALVCFGPILAQVKIGDEERAQPTWR